MRLLLLTATVLPAGCLASAIAPARSIASIGWALRRAVTIDPSYCSTANALGMGLGLDKDVAICPAGVRGYGVFALRDLQPGTMVGWYTGRLISDTEHEVLLKVPGYSAEYIMRIADPDRPAGDGQEGWMIDGEDAQTASWTRYINHSVRKRNVESFYLRPRQDFPSHFGALYIEVVAAVRAGDELLLNYGKEYWDDRAPLYQNPALRFRIDNL